MIFPHLEVESTLQTKDKTRLNAVKSYISKDEEAITLVEIEPEAGAGYVDVTGTKQSDWFLDWEYSTDGTKVATCRITTDGAPVSKTASIVVLTSANDKLFSNDYDLQQHEADILKWVSQGRNSFLNVHRRAQTLILQHLDEIGLTDTDGGKLTKADVIDITELKEWSTFMVLRLIFESISNSSQDVFSLKAVEYAKRELDARNRSVLRLDYDGDGTLAAAEGHYIRSLRIVRR